MEPLDRRQSRSLWSFVVTQFLGAFNDNAFKQLILLLAVDLALGEKGGSYQPVALALFALPFILFSGIAGSISDKLSKTRVIYWAKVGEIAIMLLGVIGFYYGSMNFLLLALFLMGTQSAFFGPAKYGVLPELLPRGHLSRANGIVLMTTFIAIILGQALAGMLKESSGDDLHLPALLCVFLAILGTLTALGIARRPPAQPTVKIQPLGDLLPILRRIMADRDMRLIVFANSFFWFVGGVMQPTLNSYGRNLMQLGPEETSYLLVTLSSGMAIGGVLGGYLSRRTVDFRLAVIGFCGIVITLGLLTQVHAHFWLVHATLFSLGVSGCFLGLPLQTYIQFKPRDEEKGRYVAAANFVNWVFIAMSAGYFGIAEVTLPVEWIVGPLAALSLAIGVCICPRLLRIELE